MKVAHKLNETTRNFYERVAPSFSATRQNAWPGWKRVAQAYAQAGVAEKMRVLDLACGNMRFANFLETDADFPPDMQIEYFGVDSCEGLAAENSHPHGKNENLVAVRRHFQLMDVMSELENRSLAQSIESSPFNLSVCFGFMHHIPKPEWRKQAIHALVKSTAKGGIVTVSFWQFLNDSKLAAKAEAATAAGCELLGIEFSDPNDALLGWQDETDAFRYCHNFTEDEIDSLASCVPEAQEICRFSADGANALNRYVVLKTR